MPSNQRSPGKNIPIVEQVRFIHYIKVTTHCCELWSVSVRACQKGLKIEFGHMLGGFRRKSTEVKFYSRLEI